MGLAKQLRAIILLPVMMTLIIPGLIIASNREMHPGWSLPLPLNYVPFLCGLLLIGLGLTLVYQTVRLFSTVGQGTLAPWEPPPTQ